MIDGVVHSLITGVVVLGGIFLTARLQQSAFAEGRRRDERNRVFETVIALMTAIDAHRFAMWVEREAVHEANGDANSARVRTQETRRAITGPQLSLRVLTPLGPSADAAVAATYAMHESLDMDDLKARRIAAVEAAGTFQAEATAFFAAIGIGSSASDIGLCPPERRAAPAGESLHGPAVP